MPVTYTNPRMRAEISNWPMGSSKRGTATFSIEAKTGKGERGVRVTREDSTGHVGKPKVLTFARKARIVDGDDGRTYIAELTIYDSVSIMRSDMQYQAETVHDGDARLPELLKLFE